MTPTIATLLTAFAITSTAFAQTLTLSGNQRFINADSAKDSSGNPPGAQATGASTGAFNQTVSSVDIVSTTTSQNTNVTLTATSFTFTGDGSVQDSAPTNTLADGITQARFLFVLSGGTFDFSLSGTTALSSGATYTGTQGDSDYASILLSPQGNNGNPIVLFGSGGPFGIANRAASGSVTGQLAPGGYELIVFAHRFEQPGTGSASFSNVSFDVRPVPEPSALGLCTVAIGGFFLRRHHGRSAAVA